MSSASAVYVPKDSAQCGGCWTQQNQVSALGVYVLAWGSTVNASKWDLKIDIEGERRTLFLLQKWDQMLVRNRGRLRPRPPGSHVSCSRERLAYMLTLWFPTSWENPSRATGAVRSLQWVRNQVAIAVRPLVPSRLGCFSHYCLLLTSCLSAPYQAPASPPGPGHCLIHPVPEVGSVFAESLSRTVPTGGRAQRSHSFASTRGSKITPDREGKGGSLGIGCSEELCVLRG